jgi:hypothetical protein
LAHGSSRQPRRPLPHWDATPVDLKAAIREVKVAIRARIEGSGRTVEHVFAAIEERIAERVAEIRADAVRGESSWTVIDFDDIANGSVTTGQLERLRRSGCLVVSLDQW